MRTYDLHQMKARLFVGFLCTIAAVITMAMPSVVSAATVYLETTRSSVPVGDTLIISAKVNAEGTTINTVDGSIAIKTGGDNVEVKEFSLANSAFGLWPRTPSLAQDGHSVTFVGGVPGGFNIEGAVLFRIVLEAKKEGKVTLTPQNMSLYASDGKGTKVPVQVKGLTIDVTPKQKGSAANDEWASLVAADTIPPEDFIVVLGQDQSMFDGKKFAFFSSLDNQTGISHYEVSENGRDAVRSGSTYVLQDQEGNTTLKVVAFDKAGNKKEARFSTAAGMSNALIAGIVIVIALLVIGVFVSRKRKSSLRSNDPFQI